LGDLALGDRVVFRGIVKDGKIMIFDTVSRQSGEELRPLATYKLLKPYTLQRVFGKVKKMIDIYVWIDTGKEIVPAVLAKSVYGMACMDDMICVTGVLKDKKLLARTANDASVIRTGVLRVDPYYGSDDLTRNVVCEFDGIVPADNVEGTWGKAWIVNTTPDRRLGFTVTGNNFTFSEISVHVKFVEDYGDWNIFRYREQASGSPYSVRYENGEYILTWRLENESSAKILFIPDRGVPGKEYTAVITAVYIN
jgi:hypothetical protein